VYIHNLSSHLPSSLRRSFLITCTDVAVIPNTLRIEAHSRWNTWATWPTRGRTNHCHSTNSTMANHLWNPPASSFTAQRGRTAP
jgi:hypothetical protein